MEFIDFLLEPEIKITGRANKVRKTILLDLERVVAAWGVPFQVGKLAASQKFADGGMIAN